MDFFEVVAKRRSVRRLQDKEIEQDKLKKILEMINSAPSAGNLQAYEVYLVREKEVKEALVDAAYGQLFIAEADVVLVFTANRMRSAAKYGARGAELYSLQDATIAAAYAQLAAVALGLATCWVGAFNEREAAGALSLPQTERPIIILPLGYPAEEPHPTKRRKIEDIVHKIK
jgi:nitroreductase